MKQIRNLPWTLREMQKSARVLALGLLLVGTASPARPAEDDGQALLEKRCGRCHAVSAGAKSRLETAPNLWDTLRSFSSDRLEFDLAEGIGSRHPAMPQIQFTSEEIASVQTYLAGY
jgi:mono/diheme cytochrome c family protein